MQSIGQRILESRNLYNPTDYDVELKMARSRKEYTEIVDRAAARLSNDYMLMTDDSGVVDGIVDGPEVIHRVGVWRVFPPMPKIGSRIPFSCNLHLVDYQTVIVVIYPLIGQINPAHVVMNAEYRNLEVNHYRLPGTRMIEIGQFSEKLISVPSLRSLGADTVKSYGFASEIHEELMRIVGEVEKFL